MMLIFILKLVMISIAVECYFPAQSLSHCEMITDDGIHHLSSSPCAAEYLTVLELDNCPLISDASLENLIGCHSLERIELYDCQLITRAGIRRLKVSCYYLSLRRLCLVSGSGMSCFKVGYVSSRGWLFFMSRSGMFVSRSVVSRFKR